MATVEITQIRKLNWFNPNIIPSTTREAMSLWTQRSAVFAGLAVGLLLASLVQWAADERARHWSQARPLRVRREGHQHHRRHHRHHRRHHRKRLKWNESLAEVTEDTWAGEGAWFPGFVPTAPSPWAARSCPLNCSGEGVCNQDTGVCLCRMGRIGGGCESQDPFPCNLKHGEQLVARCSGARRLQTLQVLGWRRP